MSVRSWIREIWAALNHNPSQSNSVEIASGGSIYQVAVVSQLTWGQPSQHAVHDQILSLLLGNLANPSATLFGRAILLHSLKCEVSRSIFNLTPSSPDHNSGMRHNLGKTTSKIKYNITLVQKCVVLLLIQYYKNLASQDLC